MTMNETIPNRVPSRPTDSKPDPGENHPITIDNEHLYSYDVASARTPLTQEQLSAIQKLVPQHINLPKVMDDWADDYE